MNAILIYLTNQNIKYQGLKTRIRKFYYKNNKKFQDNFKRTTEDRSQSRLKKESKGIKKVFNKIIAEKFPNLETKMDIEVNKIFRTPNKHITNEPLCNTQSLRNTEKRENSKKNIREKHQVIYKDKPIRIRADFSTSTIKARKG